MDPFLFAHQRGDLAVFDLATRLTTIAIRDQMVRGELLGDRLPSWLESEYGDAFREWPVLVIGAGAGGMTAAVALARCDEQLKVEIVDQQESPFFVQSSCTSRWIDPCQYDWPADNWRAGCHQWDVANQRNIPFPWMAERSDLIVRDQWVPRLADHLGQVPRPRLRFIPHTRAELKTLEVLPAEGGRPEGLLQLRFRNTKSRRLRGYRTYSAIVTATGFGAERCSLPNSPAFAGMPFWDSDPFESSACGLRGGQDREGTVLISGSGDGALQDFLRVIFRVRSAKDIYDRLMLGEANLNRATLLSGELQAERGLNWANGASYSQGYLRALQALYSQVVAGIINPALRLRIKGLGANRPRKTILVTRQDYLTGNYALNRFLVLLTQAATDDETVEIRTHTEVERITTGQLPVDRSPNGCLGHPWTVQLSDSRTHASAGTVEANVVILRHGIDSPELTMPGGEQLRNVPRPLPPAHLH